MAAANGPNCGEVRVKVYGSSEAAAMIESTVFILLGGLGRVLLPLLPALGAKLAWPIGCVLGLGDPGGWGKDSLNAQKATFSWCSYERGIRKPRSVQAGPKWKFRRSSAPP